ncbi:MAG: hypothetical protein EOP48_34460 [Sphingobacteriales bacterium]|nr:MAG: hypothetical protein EOP48_34460 [Sphingobacteriales bacterium]
MERSLSVSMTNSEFTFQDWSLDIDTGMEGSFQTKLNDIFDFSFRLHFINDGLMIVVQVLFDRRSEIIFRRNAFIL